MVSAIAGASVNVAWKEESAFKTEATPNKSFGQGVKLTTYDIDNSVEYVNALGSQDAQKSVCKEFKGAWGIETILSDPWFLCLVTGTASVPTGSASAYTHTFTPTNTQLSATVGISIDADTDSEHKLLGCTVNSATIAANVGETISVRLEGMFADFVKDATIPAASVPVEEPFSFAQASLDFPNSTTIADIQSLEMTFNRNPEFIWGLGSRTATKSVAKNREWNLKLSVVYEADSQFWNTLLGGTTVPLAAPAEVATATVTITNGAAGDALRSFTFAFANLRVEKASMPMEVGNVIKQDITIRARTLTNILAKNSTATMP